MSLKYILADLLSSDFSETNPVQTPSMLLIEELLLNRVELLLEAASQWLRGFVYCKR